MIASCAHSPAPLFDVAGPTCVRRRAQPTHAHPLFSRPATLPHRATHPITPVNPLSTPPFPRFQPSRLRRLCAGARARGPRLVMIRMKLCFCLLSPFGSCRHGGGRCALPLCKDEPNSAVCPSPMIAGAQLAGRDGSNACSVITLSTGCCYPPNNSFCLCPAPECNFTEQRHSTVPRSKRSTQNSGQPRSCYRRRRCQIAASCHRHSHRRCCCRSRRRAPRAPRVLAACGPVAN